MQLIALSAVLFQVTLLVNAQLPAWPEDFKWSSAGIPDGYNCERIIESADTKTWTDNYFCWKAGHSDPGIRWYSAGPIRGMRCTQILETADPHTWTDNYLCVPSDSPYKFSWSSAGPIANKPCIQWIETADKAGTWLDNWLCNDYYPSPPKVLPNFPDDFKWSSAGPLDRYDCLRVHESADPNTWMDNYLCWKQGYKNPNLKWSSAGAGGYSRTMICTKIYENASPYTWNDNYLCRPNNSPYKFVWSQAGPVKGKKCLHITEPADKSSYWRDNYLCA